jgi:hypothetical protein
VSFNLTAKSPELLADLVLSLNRVGYAGDSDVGRVDPMCISNYADKEHLKAKVDPPAITPALIPIPVRIVIASDGSVDHVHVIRATSAQRASIESALGQWKFKPYESEHRAIQIETGLLMATQAIHDPSSADRMSFSLCVQFRASPRVRSRCSCSLPSWRVCRPELGVPSAFLSYLRPDGLHSGPEQYLPSYPP